MIKNYVVYRIRGYRRPKKKYLVKYCGGCAWVTSQHLAIRFSKQAAIEISQVWSHTKIAKLIKVKK